MGIACVNDDFSPINIDRVLTKLSKLAIRLNLNFQIDFVWDYYGRLSYDSSVWNRSYRLFSEVFVFIQMVMFISWRHGSFFFLGKFPN